VSLEEAEKLLIRASVNFYKGNKSKAAEVLGIGRKTLHRKMGESETSEE
jgi:DNA-binding NtrC family response regulator